MYIDYRSRQFWVITQYQKFKQLVQYFCKHHLPISSNNKSHTQGS